MEFNRNARLLKPQDFRSVFNKAYRANSFYFSVLSRDMVLPQPRLGFVVAKKNVRFSVDRNRFKRVCRESFRLKQDVLPLRDFVIVAKKNAQNLSSHELRIEIDTVWRHVITRFSG